MKSYVMITGATSGLGKAFVTECAKRGFNLFITDIDKYALQVLSNSIKTYYEVDVLYKELNFLLESSFNAFWDTIDNNELKFTMLINVAGGDIEGEFFEQDTSSLLNIVKINSLSMVGMLRNIIKYRETNQKLSIINVSSFASFYPMPFKAVYSASKMFITNISTSLNCELKNYNASITTLCPSGMATKPCTLRSIKSQGFMGRVTTINTGTIASKTIDKALRGKALYIPGIVNQFLRLISFFIPNSFCANLIYNRWKKTRQIAKSIQ